MLPSLHRLASRARRDRRRFPGRGRVVRHQVLAAAEEAAKQLQEGLLRPRRAGDVRRREDQQDGEHGEDVGVGRPREVVRLLVLDRDHHQQRHHARQPAESAEKITDGEGEEEEHCAESREARQPRQDQHVDREPDRQGGCEVLGEHGDPELLHAGDGHRQRARQEVPLRMSRRVEVDPQEEAGAGCRGHHRGSPEAVEVRNRQAGAGGSRRGAHHGAHEIPGAIQHRPGQRVQLLQLFPRDHDGCPLEVGSRGQRGAIDAQGNGFRLAAGSVTGQDPPDPIEASVEHLREVREPRQDRVHVAIRQLREAELPSIERPHHLARQTAEAQPDGANLLHLVTLGALGLKGLREGSEQLDLLGRKWRELFLRAPSTHARRTGAKQLRLAGQQLGRRLPDRARVGARPDEHHDQRVDQDPHRRLDRAEDGVLEGTREEISETTIRVDNAWDTLFWARRRSIPDLRKNGEIVRVRNRHQPFHIITSYQVTAVVVTATEIELPALRAILR